MLIFSLKNRNVAFSPILNVQSCMSQLRYNFKFSLDLALVKTLNIHHILPISKPSSKFKQRAVDFDLRQNSPSTAVTLRTHLGGLRPYLRHMCNQGTDKCQICRSRTLVGVPPQIRKQATNMAARLLDTLLSARLRHALLDMVYQAARLVQQLAI
jgi:hypothetical protein